MTRFVRLDSAPGEWYGDISTVYEVVSALRHGDRPPGFFAVGVGVLYPEAIRPFLWALGDTYLAIKVAAATYSLVGLGLLFVLGRQLVGSMFGLLASAIGTVSLWWLVYSRLGDVQALTATLTVAVMVATVAAVQHPASRALPGLAALMAGLGLYLYGNTLVLPLIAGSALVVGWRTRLVHLRSIVVFGAVLAACCVPIVIELLRSPDAVVDGHIGQRLVTGWQFFPNMAEGIWRTIAGYAWHGDEGFRGNPVGAPHLDTTSLVVGVIGVGYWLTPARRRRGVFVIGSFAILHLPSILANADQVPSVSRTTAAAPIAALLVASGLWWIAEWLSSRAARAVVVGVSTVLIATVNLHAYVDDYLPGLPYGNTPIARAITDYTDQFAAAIMVRVVGTGWREGMPEFKSIVYPSQHPTRYVEDDPMEFDCEHLAMMQRPALLIWSADDELPPMLTECQAEVANRRLISTDAGLPLFNVALVV